MQGDLRPGLIDLRPLGGGISVVLAVRGATPYARLELATARQGEPDREQSVEALLAQGLAVVLHREQVVDPARPLVGEPLCPITVVRRVGSSAVYVHDVNRDSSPSHTLLPDSRSRRHSVGLTWVVVSVSLFARPPLARCFGFGRMHVWARQCWRCCYA